MVLYYAMGGGLGHLTRARAVLHTLALGPAMLLTASPFARDPRVHGPHDVVLAPPALAFQPARYHAWLRTLFARLRPRQLVLDAFPAGLRGEFCHVPVPPGVEVLHVARRLRWDTYARRLTVSCPRLHRAWVLEPLPAAQTAFLRAHADAVTPLTLTDPPALLGDALSDRLGELRRRQPLWLIVHAGSEGETHALLDDARRQARTASPAPHLVLVAPHRPAALASDVTHLDVYPAALLFPLADRLFTAGGFNTMRQAAPYRARHHARPFPRRFDDQRARVLRADTRWAPAEGTAGGPEQT